MIIEAEVKGFHCQPEGVSQTGKISSGWIQLEPSIIECSLLANGREAFADRGGWTEMVQADVTLLFDCKDELKDPRHIFFMVQMVTIHRPPDSTYKSGEKMILIEPVGDLNNSFKRVVHASYDYQVSALPWPKERRLITAI